MFPDWFYKRKRVRSDEKVLAGETDPIAKAGAWAQHVVDREYPGGAVCYAVTMVEVEVDGQSTIAWASSDRGLSAMRLRGMLREVEAHLESLRLRSELGPQIQAMLDRLEEFDEHAK